MSESRCIRIYDEADIINARLLTRQMAKDAGLSIMDQARISLAVSSLAHVIRLGDSFEGQVVLNRIVDTRRSGIQVIWKMKPNCDFSTIVQELSNSTVEMMVHELDVEVSETSGICITAMMWTPPPTRRLMMDGAA